MSASHTQSIPPAPVADLLDEFDLLAHFKKRNIRTIRRWIIDGKLPPHLRLGRKKYWLRGKVLAFIEERSTASGRPASKRKRRAAN